jgi:hypothetical protein
MDPVPAVGQHTQAILRELGLRLDAPGGAAQAGENKA